MFSFQKNLAKVACFIGIILATSMLSACSDESYIEKNVDKNFYSRMRNFYPENCSRIEFRHTNELNCRLIVNKSNNTQTRFQIELKYNQIIRYSEMRNAAFWAYVEDAITNTSDKIKNCDSKSGSKLLFCENSVKLDIDKIYWSVFNPVYVKEAYGCDVKNDIFNQDPMVKCGDKEISKVELSMGSYFDASKGLMLTEDEKNLWSDVFMKKELNEKEYDIFSDSFSINQLK